MKGDEKGEPLQNPARMKKLKGAKDMENNMKKALLQLEQAVIDAMTAYHPAYADEENEDIREDVTDKVMHCFYVALSDAGDEDAEEVRELILWKVMHDD